MSRVPDVSPEEMTPRQQELAKEIAGTREGAVRGPFAIWLRMPELAAKANEFGNALRLQGTIEKRLFELAILVVARSWSAQYQWFAHEWQALEAKVAPATVEAIRAGKRPQLDRQDEALVYQVAFELSVDRDLSEATYRAAEAHFGLNMLIELITVIGFYSLVAIVLKGFDAPVPGDARPLPDLEGMGVLA